jgi:hypothetical protein
LQRKLQLWGTAGFRYGKEMGETFREDPRKFNDLETVILEGMGLQQWRRKGYNGPMMC